MRYLPGDVCEPASPGGPTEFVIYDLEPLMSTALVPKFRSQKRIRGEDLFGLTFVILAVSVHGYQVAASNGVTGFVFAHDIKMLDEI